MSGLQRLGPEEGDLTRKVTASLNSANGKIKGRQMTDEKDYRTLPNGERDRESTYIITNLKEVPTQEQQRIIKEAIKGASAKGAIEDVKFFKASNGDTVIEVKGGMNADVDYKKLQAALVKNQEAFKDVKIGMGAEQEVQNKVTIPAAPVKVGQVGKGSAVGLDVVSKGTDGKDYAERIRGSAEFKIMQDKDGKLTAIADRGYGDPAMVKSTGTVNQQITATMDGVDGKPKQVTFNVGKDGTLTEVKPQATPKGGEKDPAQSMR